jgi:phosphate uptake regulator
MFDWFKPTDTASGIEKMRHQLGQMLVDGRHVFDAAANAFLGGADPEVVRENLFATDKRINDLERQIRREVLVHGTVHGTSQLPTCLVLMSIVKDAERIGDYSKNLFDLAVAKNKSKDDFHADLVEHKDQVSNLLREAFELYGRQDEAAAKKFLERGDAMQDHYDAQVERLLSDDPGTREPVATALAYRYYKRVVAHALNIITSLVMPVDQLDYFDEDPETRE